MLMRARSMDGGQTWDKPVAIATSAKQSDPIPSPDRPRPATPVRASASSPDTIRLVHRARDCRIWHHARKTGKAVSVLVTSGNALCWLLPSRQ